MDKRFIQTGRRDVTLFASGRRKSAEHLASTHDRGDGSSTKSNARSFGRSCGDSGTSQSAKNDDDTYAYSVWVSFLQDAIRTGSILAYEYDLDDSRARVYKQEMLLGGRFGMKKMTTIEVEAATREEAIRKALKILKVKKQEVNVEILKEEHKGLFGMEGAHPAKIRITLKENK
jgi:hypothetical protein